jgi:hypothetical protein
MSLNPVIPFPNTLPFFLAPSVADAAVDLYRENGFPVYGLNLEEKFKQLKSLLRYDRSQLIENGNVQQTMHGLALAWSYFPHAWSVRCGEKRTPLELFFDDELFPKAVAKCRQMHDRVADSTLRKTLRIFSGTQSVSNYRPTAAAAIYDHFLPKSGGVVWDMSAGFGGRMLGAIASRRVTRYIGTDPATLTMEGLCEMRDEVLPLANSLGFGGLEIELHKCGSEDFVPQRESLDLAFTSPPYMGHEEYSDEPTQSYIKFKTREEWLHGFMKQTLANCHIGLKPKGKLVVNIAGVKSYPTLHDDFVAMAEANGWKLEQTLQLCLSKMPGTGKRETAFKHEPIFVFRKKG